MSRTTFSLATQQLPRHIVLHCSRPTTNASRIPRAISTTSAINKGLRASRESYPSEKTWKSGTPIGQEGRLAGRYTFRKDGLQRMKGAATEKAPPRSWPRHVAESHRHYKVKPPLGENYKALASKNEHFVPRRYDEVPRVIRRNAERVLTYRQYELETSKEGAPAEVTIQNFRDTVERVHALMKLINFCESRFQAGLRQLWVYIRETARLLESLSKLLQDAKSDGVEHDKGPALVALANLSPYIRPADSPDSWKATPTSFIVQEGTRELSLRAARTGKRVNLLEANDLWERENEQQSTGPPRARPDVSADVYSGPVSVPYTTAASEFLYGSNPVLAALRAKRRKIYALHLDRSISQLKGAKGEIVALATKAGVAVRENADTKFLNKISEDRPNQGVALEVSKLPAPPVLGVGRPSSSLEQIPLNLGYQTPEDASVNGLSTSLYISNPSRQPLILLLDGIIDPQNLGSILRTAHFYGVDAVAVAVNTCANLSSATLAKASSGACEAVPIFALPQPAQFVHESRRAGWIIWASVAPPSKISGNPALVSAAKKHRTTAQISSNSPLARRPCILMLGAEGAGLRDNLRKRADGFVSIMRGQQPTKDVGVDSINVGVAAGVLLEAFMSAPKQATDAKWKDAKDAKDAKEVKEVNET